MECTDLQMLAAETLYNMERGVRPVVFGSSKTEAENDKKKTGRVSAVKAALVAGVVLLLSVHFSGVLKNSVTGRVVGSHGPINCDIRFHSSSGAVCCSTDASGRFSTRLYGGVYRVVVEKRPGLPMAYQRLSTTPLRVRAEDGLVLRIVD